MSDNKTLSTIFNRTSYRGSFKPDPIPREDLTAILKAGVAAPSGCNRQTASFMAVDDPALLAEIRKIFPNPSCQSAPALILVFTQEIVGVDGHYYHVQDYSAAMENMLLAIKSMGYESCWFEGNLRKYAKEISDFFHIPDPLKLVCLLPVGTPADAVPQRKETDAFKKRAWFNGFGI